MNKYKSIKVLKWRWPEKCERMLLVREEKVNALASMQTSDLLKANHEGIQLCYRAEYEQFSGLHYYLQPDDYGELRFYVIPIFSNFKLDERDQYQTVVINGYKREVSMKVRTKRIRGTNYYKTIASIHCIGKGFEVGELLYQLKGSTVLYTVPIRVNVGQNKLPPILSKEKISIEFLFKQNEKLVRV